MRRELVRRKRVFGRALSSASERHIGDAVHERCLRVMGRAVVIGMKLVGMSRARSGGLRDLGLGRAKRRLTNVSPFAKIRSIDRTTERENN